MAQSTLCQGLFCVSEKGNQQAREWSALLDKHSAAAT
jgi:hypothetical protein